MSTIFWGIGRDFQEAVSQYPDLLESADTFIDMAADIEAINGKPVIRPEDIPALIIDKIIISTSKHFKEIYALCKENYVIKGIHQRENHSGRSAESYQDRCLLAMPTEL